MATLKLTEEEKQAINYLQWSDDAIGKACKVVAEILRDGSGERAMRATGAAVFLISMAHEVGSEASVFEIKDATQGSQSFGSWKITVEKTAEPVRA